MVVCLIGLSGFAVRADEPRPFFNEFNLHGGGVYFNGQNGAGVVGASFDSGIDFGKAGFEFLFKILYGPTTFGAGSGTQSPFLGLDVGLRIVVYSDKLAFKFGPIYGAGGNRSAATAGVGPTFGVFYQTSRTYPVYVGYGAETQVLMPIVAKARSRWSTGW